MSTSKKNKMRRYERPTTVKAFITLVVCFFGSMLLISETAAVLLSVLPAVGITMFDAMNHFMLDVPVSIPMELTFSELSVYDAVMTIMMWLLPSIGAVLLIIFIQWKFMCFMMRKLINMFKATFLKRVSVRGTQKNVSNNNIAADAVNEKGEKKI